MNRCPILNFDDHGDECVPELCSEYTEDWESLGGCYG